MKNLFIIALLAITSCSIMQVQEEEAPAPEPRLTYISIGGVYGIQQFDFSDTEQYLGFLTSSDVNVSADNSPGIDLRIGYRFDDHIALEGQYTHFYGGDIDAKSDNPLLADTEIADYNAWALFFNFRGYFTKPTETFQPYGLIGGGLVSVEVDNKIIQMFEEDTMEMAVKLGGGLDVRLTDRLFLYFDAAYIWPTDHLEDYNMIPLSLGLQVRF